MVSGHVDDVRPYLAHATVFACPLRFGAGIKNKVLEAMAMACPVVATPLSVDGIQVRPDHEVLVADTSGFADAVVRVLRDDELRSALGLHSRSLIERRYTWAIVASAYEQMFEDVRVGRVVS
jgi:glycosyltransferase involved in cell wall biosynthesis